MSKNILLIEDNIDYQNMLKQLLTNHGYEVSTADNGQDGLETIKKDGTSIDIIITDLHMPFLNGLEMAKEVFSKKLSRAPIIILTTETSVKMRREGIEAGVHHWVIKPVQEEKFLGTVDLLFSRYCKQG